MSIQKKSLISKRAAAKKANLTKGNPAKAGASTKLGKVLLAPGIRTTAKLAQPSISPRISQL
jgi:hypothetical protein